jgi:hypothetical protein
MTRLAARETLTALHLLRNSGRRSFEHLLADIFAQLAGVPFRPARAGGPQGGADAFAPTAVAMEAKLYRISQLGERELRGEIDEATERRDLELWILCASAPLDDQKRRNLEQSAARKGISFLVFDTTHQPPLPPEVPALAALCATAAERVLAVLQDPEWRLPETQVPDLAAVDSELAAIRALPEFARFSADLRTTLQELPTWRRLVDRQNARLLQQIRTDAWTAFRTPFDPGRAVRRTLQDNLSGWCRSALRSPAPDLAVLTGQRFGGKTWCLFGWLLEELPALTLPVFLVASPRGAQGVPLYDQILAQARAALGASHEHHAEAVLRRAMDTARGGDTPWCVLLLEGLNEYKLHPHTPFEHLAWAQARGEPERRPCACLCTVRRQTWTDHLAPGLPEQVRDHVCELEIRPYDDGELLDALAHENQTLEWFDARPAAVQDLLRRPRYLHLVTQQSGRLDAFAGITEEVLHWLDATDKIRREHPSAPADWNEISYQSVLADLARRHLEHPVLSHEKLYESLRRFTDDRRAALETLSSEGVLRTRGQHYEVDADSLRTGMGLFILQQLADASAARQPLTEALHDLLDPLRDTDQTVSYLGTAAVFSLLAADEEQYAAAVVDTLVTAWLSSRNLSSEDVAKLCALAPLLLEPLLRLAPETWSFARDASQLQEVTTLLCLDALRSRRDLLATYLRRWLRTVPTNGGWAISDHEDAAQQVAARLADPALTRFHLEARSDNGCLRLHNLVIYLESRQPGLLTPDDCLAYFATQHAAQTPATDGQLLVVRRILSATPLTWFEEQATACLDSPTGTKIVYALLCAADRHDLAPLVAKVEASRPPPSFRFEGSELSRERYDRLLTSPPEDPPADPLGLLTAARGLVVDPELPRPSADRLASVRDAWAAHFAAVDLQLDRSPSGDDLLFEATLPAMAAWAPAAAAAVIRLQISDLPRRIRVGQHWWSHQLRQHAVLVEGESRDALGTLLAEDHSDIYHQLAARFSLLAILPGLAAADRVEVILAHRMATEFRTLYDFVEELDDDRLEPLVLAHLDRETDPKRLLRVRLLLSTAGRTPLSSERIQALCRDLARGGDRERHGVLAVAVRLQVRDLPPDLLLPIVTKPSAARSSLPRWSASLLAVQGAHLDRLPAYWRAVAAATHGASRPELLRDVESALLQPLRPAPPAPLDGPTIEIRPGCDTRPTSRRLAVHDEAPGLTMIRPESTIGGRSGQDGADLIGHVRQVFDEDALIRRQKSLQDTALAALAEGQYDLGRAWSSERFPQALIDGLEPDRLTAWIAALVALPAAKALWSWYGLVVAVFRRVLREGHAEAANLWPLVQPFQRSADMRPARFLVGTVDWILVELSSPRADHDTARRFLRHLLLDCRTDGEILDLAVGARYRDPTRAIDLARELLQHSDPEHRCRAARLAGWLPGTEPQLREAANGDNSLWVRRIAAEALETRTREQFARHWLRRFLDPGSRDERWAAGQLFLASLDAASPGWLWDALRGESLDPRTRGEALLLLAEAEDPAKRARQELDATFLRHQISNLDHICSPWHRQHGWGDIA